MFSFESDYIEGCHPLILERLVQTNMEQVSGYGHDKFSDSAKDKIRKACNCPDAQIQFITGGTQTNQIVIDTMLKPYEGVVAAGTGHVACHEAGAIEYTGHKVLTVPGYDGKMKACDLDSFCKKFFDDGNNEHMVFPGMVYVSQPTEYGTVYTKSELKQIADVAHKYNLPLFADGARLGYALECDECDMTLSDMAEICDVFYIGGTKVGALCGEAVVYTKNNMPAHFENLVKKHGALLAKGRLNALQFDVLFTDELYFKISRHAIEMAKKIKELFAKAGIPMYIDSPTNQQFVCLEDEKLKKIQEKVACCFWEKADDTHTVVRFASSWATTQTALDELSSVLSQLN